MNELFIGHTHIPTRNKGVFLFIHDEIPKRPLAESFDPTKHSLDALRNISPLTAKRLARALYEKDPHVGTTTLTIQNAKRALAPALFAADRFDLVKPPHWATKAAKDELTAFLEDLLFDPTISSVLTGKNPIFGIKANTTVLARLNRAEIGDDAAYAIGQVLIALSPHHQIIIPDLCFYGRDPHVQLIRENRLSAGVSSLEQLPLQLRNACLRIPTKHVKGALYDDALLLAKMDGTYTKDQHGFSDKVSEHMGR